MKKILLTLLGLGFTLPTFAAQPAKAGLWEYSFRMEMPGMPTQPMTHKVCQSAQDMEASPVPQDDHCKLKNYKLSGNTATWQVECQGEAGEKMSGEGSVTFQNDSAYSGETRMRIQAKGQPAMEMKQKFSAKRVGDCKK
ncbi:MAG: DUF3617 domain-containing protein [Azovibrio sp.]|nr:DUF3617 domain-containing protein [Azovibrio sp.]